MPHEALPAQKWSRWPIKRFWAECPAGFNPTLISTTAKGFEVPSSAPDLVTCDLDSDQGRILVLEGIDGDIPEVSETNHILILVP
jgi:hypothetical protein